MKKTITINLGGQAIIIDEDAFIKLDSYLKTIESYFQNENERKEIIEDVEYRIAEILKDKLSNKKEVVNIKDIDEVIEIMGDPSDFEPDKEPVNNEDNKQRKSYRRIYRDPDNKVLSGVCGGLGAYFGFDPLVLRILFIVAFLAFGSGLLIYIVLWIVIPEAKTFAQKLEMKGEEVTISNIGKKVKDEFKNMKDNIKFL
jgi:phage shock protein PspC (stress-responsive transcriptional regulator)